MPQPQQHKMQIFSPPTETTKKNKPQLHTVNNLSCACLPALIPHPEIAHLTPDSSLKIPSLNNRVPDDT